MRLTGGCPAEPRTRPAAGVAGSKGPGPRARRTRWRVSWSRIARDHDRSGALAAPRGGDARSDIQTVSAVRGRSDGRAW